MGKNEMTSFVFMWEALDGSRRWEAVKKEQVNGFLKKLLDDGVHPATVMVAYAPILFHYVWKEYHRGLSDVNFHNINNEIYGMEPQKSNHEPVQVQETREPENQSTAGSPLMAVTSSATTEVIVTLPLRLWGKWNRYLTRSFTWRAMDGPRFSSRSGPESSTP